MKQLLHSALSQNREKDPERQDRHFHSVLEATRKSVLSVNHQAVICKEMNNNGLHMLSLLPYELLAIYQKPWFCGDHALSYFLETKDLPALRAVMQKLSFDELATDPLEIDHNTQWSFEHPDGTRVTFITEMPFYFDGSCKTFADSLRNTLLREWPI